eukprot:CAMPEP_0175109562 /NCGR_PEP_ID=MMETSP0086_2-20121207/13445_1 /TAXON_ID=136419 /ORGANISM="Unknown Unknown, Strain D1" /LENGTH=43 /DNA_ID= /DNA_START= /DNA_END= /DNA_ORIENTATION=
MNYQEADAASNDQPPLRQLVARNGPTFGEEDEQENKQHPHNNV